MFSYPPSPFRTKNFVSTSYPTNPTKSPMMADQKPLPLSEESTDDILYFARAGETDDLLSTLKSIVTDSATLFSSEAEVLFAAKDEYSGNNAVHMAAGNGHLETIKHILSFLPKPVSGTAPPHPLIAHKNTAGNTPLHWAALNGHVKIVEVLVLTANADPTVTNDAGHDPVYEAELNEKMDVVEWILGNCGGVEEGVGVKQERETSGESSVQEGIEKLDLYKGDSREETSS
ncbi:ankyrin repeat-containing protein [Maublancomyces gigas]|uniref:Ankyrin repeat-containing protein n=1 Tax=Discina gigas TaxID=1032678 RepID=A0ABR3GUD9_9PEZI